MKFLISFFIIISTAFNSRADVGSCALYKCSINLDNKTTIEGYLQFWMPATTISKGNELLNQIKKRNINQNNPSIAFYSKIQNIKYPRIKNSENFSYTAASIADTRLIHIKNILSIQIIQITSCECFSDEKGNPNYSKSIFDIRQYHQIIDDLTQHEIDLLNSSTPIFTKSISGSDIDGSIVMNYNPKLEKEEFERLANLLNIKKQENQSWTEYSKIFEDNYNKVRTELRKKGIIVIKLISYC
ncbi:MAG: hypothetical protein ACPGSO_04955 [Vicingaceae bacterium]